MIFQLIVKEEYLTETPKVEWIEYIPATLSSRYDASLLKCVFNYKTKKPMLIYQTPSGPYEIAPDNEYFLLQLVICDKKDGIFRKEQLIRKVKHRGRYEYTYNIFKEQLSEVIESARLKGDPNLKNKYDKRRLFDSISKLAQRIFKA